MNKELVEMLGKWFYLCGTMPSTEDKNRCCNRAEMLATFIEQEGYVIIKKSDLDRLGNPSLGCTCSHCQELQMERETLAGRGKKQEK